MNRHTLYASIGALALTVTAPAAAQLLGGKGGVAGGVGSTVQGTVGAQGTAKGTVKSATDKAAGAAANARAQSQGAAKASVQGTSKASTKSSLNAAGRTDLGAVVKGTAIKGSGGANVGTVSEVVVNRSGAVVGVKVDLEGGGTATIPASTLSVDGSAVTTTWVHKH